MYHTLLTRRFIVGVKVFAAFVFLAFCAGTAFSQDAQTPVTLMFRHGQDPAEVEQMMKSATATGRPVVVQWQDATAAPATAEPPATEPVPERSASDLTGIPDGTQQVQRFMNGLSMGLSGISGIRSMAGDVRARMEKEGNGLATTLLAALGTAALASLASYVFVKLSRQIIRHKESASQTIFRFRASLVFLIVDGVALLIFAAVSHFSLRQMLPVGTVSYDLARSLMTVLVVTGGYLVVARFLFAPMRPDIRLLRIDNPRWHFMMLVAYGAIGVVVGETVRFADGKQLDEASIEGWFLIGATILTLLKLRWFLGGRRDIGKLFTGENPGYIRKLIGYILPEFYAVTAVILWVVGCMVAGTPDSDAWSFAAGSTQIILLAIPLLALGLHSLAGAFARQHLIASDPTPLKSAAVGGLSTAMAGAVWLLGLHLILLLWKPIMFSGGAQATVAWIVALEHVSLAVVVSWALFSFLRDCFEAYAPAGGLAMPGSDDDGIAPFQPSRLASLLPLLRNLIFGGIVGLTALIILSSLGVDIAPLIAGFGVLGLALSFGSQTLVKDIVSGVFFIADDAFRVGEYVDTGKLKGTVEKLSLRSLRLRHQNGQVHTIPYGQLQAVTNFSRDWSTIKFELKFDRDADIEQIRKTVKKVGLAMLADPELGSEFITPLKMQGVQDVTENSLVVRLKFTSKPGNPSILQRQAMKQLLFALKEAGISLASNAVTVRSNAAAGDGAAEAAAANASIMATKKAQEDLAEG